MYYLKFPRIQILNYTRILHTTIVYNYLRILYIYINNMTNVYIVYNNDIMINHIITKKTFESCGVGRKSKTHAGTHSTLGKKRNFNFVNKHEPYN